MAAPSAADKATARTLMDDGDKKMAAKDFEGALKAYSAAHAIMDVPTTAIEVARAQAAMDLWLEGQDTCLAVTRMAVAPNEPPQFKDARKECNALIRTAGAKLGTVRFKIEGAPVADVSVTMDGASVPSAVLATLRKANPGKHVVIGQAKGYSDAQANVTVSPGDETEAALSFKKSGAPAAAAEVPPVGEARKAPAPAAQDEPVAATPASGSPSRTAGWVVAGLGVAGLATAGVAAGLVLSKKSTVGAHCDAGWTCDSTGLDAASSGKTFSTVGTVGFAVGIVGLGLGSYLLLRSPDGSTSVGVATGPTGGALRFARTF